jgi:hypothetical protein
MSTGNLQGPPFLVPGSGKVVKQTGAATSETVASGLMFPISMGFSPDGGLYVSTPAIGADQGQGAILWVAGTKPTTAAATTACAPIPATLSPAKAATPVGATPVS